MFVNGSKSLTRHCDRCYDYDEPNQEAMRSDCRKLLSVCALHVGKGTEGKAGNPMFSRFFIKKRIKPSPEPEVTGVNPNPRTAPFVVRERVPGPVLRELIRPVIRGIFRFR